MRKHDIDLLRGVYKYGYANYSTIRYAKEFCFKELEKSIAYLNIFAIIAFFISFFIYKANTYDYQNFPSSDALTRRLKKLI